MLKILAGIILCGLAQILCAQGTASILGTVLDPSGASIAGATVTVRNTATGLTRSLKSDVQGRYLVSDLPIGAYEVEGTQPGFQTVIRKDIGLTVGSQPVVDLQLPVGQTEQAINVTAEVSRVETTSAAVSSLVNQTQMRELPLNGRNVEQLILLAPGAQTYPAGQQSALVGRGTPFSISGSRPGVCLPAGRRELPELVAARLRRGGDGHFFGH